MSGKETPFLSVTGITKSFGPVQVLFGIDLEFRPGEVHALLGENGAGKSTLVKILSGCLKPDGGVIRIAGAATEMDDVGAGEDLGIVLIHQEFNLAEQLTVEENIFLGREMRNGWLLDKGAMRGTARRLLEQLQSSVDPDSRVQDIGVADKQMVEIAKAMLKNARLLIMDEPTAVLTSRESEILFRLIGELQQQGVAIVYISHKLDEIEAVADRVTILRDGHQVTSRSAADLSKDEMVRLMVGRQIDDLFPGRRPPPVESDIVLDVRNFEVSGQVRDASFDLRRGEVLGFAGLVGAGRTALMEAVVGLRDKTRGRLFRGDREVAVRSLADASALRIAYLTKDRKGRGLVLNMNLRHNLTLLALDHFGRFLIDEVAERTALDRAVEEFDIRTGNIETAAGSLSGGNQQKLLLAKIMQIDPEILIIDEPTRGIDVGTKHQIYLFIDALTRQGRSCILLSSEMPEIIGLSDRVVVMREGSVTGVLEGDAIEEHEIMRYATGLKSQKGGNRDDHVAA